MLPRHRFRRPFAAVALAALCGTTPVIAAAPAPAPSPRPEPAPAAAPRPSPGADADGWIELAPGVRLLRGAFVPGTQPDGNSIVLDGPEGLVVVDTGRHPEHTARIVALARRLGKPVRAVVNTHWHLDHVGGNPRLRREYPDLRVHASTAIEGAMTGFLARYRKYLEETIPKTAAAAERAPLEGELAILDAGKALGPDEPVTASGPRTLAGRPLRLELESRAVTAGDVWLLDPATRILVAGDLVTLPVPFLDTACPQRWQAALDHLAGADWVLLVPGHGAPMTRSDLDVYRQAFAGLLACAATSDPAPTCIDGWITAAGPLLAGTDTAFVRSLVGYYVDNSLRGDPTTRKELCGG